MSEHITEPVVRIRLNHSYTIKNGWALSDSTVEMTVPVSNVAAGAAVFPDLADLLRNAYDTGTFEADERNRLEGRPPK